MSRMQDRSKSKPGRKFETHTHEDGTKWDIRWDKERRKFLCCDEEAYIEGDSPDEVREALKLWLAKNRSLTWEPIIVVKLGDRWDSSTAFGFMFQRYFRAFTPSKKKIIRKWDLSKAQKKRVQHTHGLVVDAVVDVGVPGAQTRANTDELVLEYTPARWYTLRQLEKAVDAVARRFKKFIQGAENLGEDKGWSEEWAARQKVLEANLGETFKRLGGAKLLKAPEPGPDGVLDAALGGAPKKKAVKKKRKKR